VIHLDANATTPVDPAVLAAMLPWFRERQANPSSLHPRGEAAADALAQARASVAALVGGKSEEVCFTSGGSESIATAFRCAAARRPERARVLTSTVEHSAVRANAEHLARSGWEWIEVPVDREGRLDRAELLAQLEQGAGLVSLMLANNETGVVTDLDGVGDACRAAGAAFHVDAIQGPGKLPLDLRALGAHMVSLSAHKFHGPQGCGALVVEAGFPFAPLILGGEQEDGRRAGTENVPGIVGLGAAARLARGRSCDRPGLERLRGLRDALERALLERVPGTRVHGAGAPRLANTSNVAFAGLEAVTLLALLGAEGIAVSAGSACNARRQAPSPVLLAMGCERAEAAGSLRFSLSWETTPAEIERAIEAVVEAAATLRILG